MAADKNTTIATRCWCAIPMNAQIAVMDARDRLNPGRAYYRCGNYGLGATCSFFAWVTMQQQPQPQLPQQHPPQQMASSSRGGVEIKHTRIPKTPERKVSALTAALEGCGDRNTTQLSQAGIDREELEKMFGKKKKKRRTSSSSSSSSSSKSTPTMPTTPGLNNNKGSPSSSSSSSQSSPSSPITEPEQEQQIDPSPPHYHPSTPPISIPSKRDNRISKKPDILHELDKKHQMMLLMRNTNNTNPLDYRRRPNTFPLDTKTQRSRRRICLEEDEYDEREEDGVDIEDMDDDDDASIEKEEERHQRMLEEEFFVFPYHCCSQSSALIYRRASAETELRIEERG